MGKIGNGFKRMGGFFKDCWSELKKVRWPNRKEMVSYTLVVITTVTIIGIFFAVIDLGLSAMIRFIFQN